MMRLPRPFAVAVVAAIATIQVAAALDLPTTPGSLGAGTALVLACDTDGFTYRHAVDTAGRITTVTVGAMDLGCAGGMLRLTLTNGTTGAGEGTAGLPASGFTGSATVSVAPAPLSSTVSAIYVVVEGP